MIKGWGKIFKKIFAALNLMLLYGVCFDGLFCFRLTNH